ncbi:MAG: gluconate 2-dehydrogenase subunit 3 family protein [Gemmatimonadaceae bacterium]
MTDSFHLTPPGRASLDALCRRIAPIAYEGREEAVDLAAAVERRLASGDHALARQVAALLAMFDHPLAGMLTTGQPRRFSALSAEAQDAALRSWEESRVGVRRTVFQALRRLILSTYYALPQAGRAIGYRGPLHRRAPEVPWEGPLSGVASDDEPVARMTTAWDDTRSHPAPRDIPPGVVEGHQLGPETAVRAGVCVVGSGAGGAVVAARLAECGHDVVILLDSITRGPRPTPPRARRR